MRLVAPAIAMAVCLVGPARAGEPILTAETDFGLLELVHLHDFDPPLPGEAIGATRRQDFDRARSLVEQGLDVFPEEEALLELRDQLAKTGR